MTFEDRLRKIGTYAGLNIRQMAVQIGVIENTEMHLEIRGRIPMKRRSSSGDPTRVRVLMRGRGADHPVVVLCEFRFNSRDTDIYKMLSKMFRDNPLF